jgi:hypothetical protein
MFSKFSFWIWSAIVSQLLSAAFHSISFFIKPAPANDTEKQLHDLMTNYKMDMGAGISRSFTDIFLSLSICFTLICVLGGIINWYMKKKNVSADIWKGLLLIEAVIFGILFLVMLKFTFLPPIVCTGAIFFFLLGTYFATKPAKA